MTNNFQKNTDGTQDILNGICLDQELTMLFETLDIPYNSVVVGRLAMQIEDMITSGELSNPNTH